jgi:histidinol-phosphate aminotransferase
MFELENIVRKNICSLNAYSSARDEFTGDQGVFLDANENPYGSLNRYPDPYQRELKDLLSKRLDIPSTNLFIGNGSDEVLDLVFRVFCAPSTDKALTFIPTYGMYKVLSDINDVELLESDLTDDFNIDLDSVQEYLNNPKLKLILICSPNNPTGNTLELDTLENILNVFNGVVLVDEAYMDFNPEKSAIELIDKYPNLIVSRTMSKAWGLAGARIGMAISNPGIITYLNKVKPPYNVSTLNQKAAIEALKKQADFDENKKCIMEEKDKLMSSLLSIPQVKKIYPSDTNFLLVEVENADELYDQLVKKRIIVRNRNRQVKNCLRITVGSENENKLLIETLKKTS